MLNSKPVLHNELKTLAFTCHTAEAHVTSVTVISQEFWKTVCKVIILYICALKMDTVMNSDQTEQK